MGQGIADKQWTGVKNCWLKNKSYARAARKGWLVLTTYLNADANLREVCEGTNKKNDISYYLNRGRNTGDLHGQAPLSLVRLSSAPLKMLR